MTSVPLAARVFSTLLFATLMLSASAVFSQMTVRDRIAYTCQNDICLMNPNGTGQIKLTNTPTLPKNGPVWSPDGTMIVWRERAATNNTYSLHVMNADGSNQRYLADMPWGFSSAFSWSPDSRKIAFTGGSTGSEISVINADGTNLVVLTNAYGDDPNAGQSKNPAWSPDGSTIVFARQYRVGFDMRWVIYLMNPDGSNQRRVIAPEDPDPNFVLEYGDNHNAFYWSPDGTKIAFYRRDDSFQSNPKTGLFVMNSNGTKATQITKDGSFWEYSWSPDSERIAYRNYPGGIDVIRADGSGRRHLTTNASDVSPAWSNDGKKIAFASNRVGDFNASEIYVMNADGQGLPTKVTVNTVYDGTPMWKPQKACDCDTLPRPQSQTVQSNWPAVNGINVNWSMQAEVTDDDGLVLRHIRLGSRYLANQISVPYYTLETSAFAKGRGELKPDSADALMRSRLISYEVTTDEEKLVIEAIYAVDRISQSCLEVRQRYEFYKQGVGGRCEPSGELPCSRWKPIVKYKFSGAAGETLRSISIPQRQHFRINENVNNSIGLFRDCDYPPTCGISGGNSFPGMVGFERKFNPLFDEWSDRAIVGGRDANQWDNIHQTDLADVGEPRVCVTCVDSKFVGGGCPECIHSHWRWAAMLPEAFGSGRVIGIPPSSNQDLDFAIVKNNPNEDDPEDFATLADGERIRHPATGNDPQEQLYDYSAPDDIVVWYSGTGYQNLDAFFGHGGFFNPAATNKRLYGGTNSLSAQSLSAQSLNDSGEDGLTSVVAANVYVDGETTASVFDPAVLGPLPTGYTVYNNLSYDVQTEAEVSGPHTVTFSVASAIDQTAFNSLRIFHAEQDHFEPDKIVWVDRTSASDFAGKTITAKAGLLGQFVVASLSDPQPPNINVADLAVSSSDSPDQVVAGNNLTYTFTVTNNGPQPATGITFSDTLPPNSEFVSVSSSQGRCADKDGSVVCKLDGLNSATSSTVTVVVRPAEGTPRLPQSGKVITSTVQVRANEADANLSNNIATESTTVMPDTNLAPNVSITTPGNGKIFRGSLTLSIIAAASDTDGSISKVDFYSDGELIGTGALVETGKYRFDWVSIPYGSHSLMAVATDDAGKTSTSGSVNILINGLASVNITSPSEMAEFIVPANVTINADATAGGAGISKVDFYANGELIGTGSFTGNAQYSLNWNCATSGAYLLTAVVTESNGITTTSAPVRVYGSLKGNAPPVVNLTDPASGAVITTPGSTTLTASASDTDGSISKVDFYANEALIGTGATTGAGQYSFTWTSPPRGDYVLTAVAWDNGGMTTVSGGINVTAKSPALLVTGSTTLNEKDAAVKSRLEARGFTVTVKDGTTVTSADATGKAVVVISSTVTPTAVGTKFRTVAVPVVLWESGLFANMGMTGSTNKDFGTATRQLDVSIINSAHPLAAGLSGSTQVYALVSTTGTLNWGAPNANAAKVATVVGSPTKVVIFGYVGGAQMPGLAAPARRVGFYMDDTTGVSYEGWLLFDAAINWATTLP